jgi:hypothetical protein
MLLASAALSLLTCFVLLGSVSAGVIAEPFAQLSIDSEVISLPIKPGDDGKTWIIDNVMRERPGEWRVFVAAELNPDPDITYAVAVTDFGAPSTFGFIFSQPIVPTSTPGIVSHTHSSSTTNGGGGAGTPVTAVAPPALIPTDSVARDDEIAVYTLSTDGGVSFLNAGMDLNPSFVGASPSGVQGPFNEGPAAGPAAAGSTYDVMRVDINFSMDGSSDAFTFNGRAFVIPEPSSLILVITALAGVACVRRRA